MFNNKWMKTIRYVLKNQSKMKFSLGILPQREHFKEQRSFIHSYQDVTKHAMQCNQHSLMATAEARRAKESSVHPAHLLRPVRSHLL